MSNSPQKMKFKICSTQIEVSFITVAVMSIVLVLDISGKIAMCFLCALLHEGGHIVAMRFWGITPQIIKLRLFDIVIIAESSKTYRCDFVVTLCGPLMNLILAFIFCLVYKPFAVVNLILALFNLLPVETFDGGRALQLLLLKKYSPTVVRNVLKLLTFVILVPTFTLGVLILFCSKYNYSLLLISLYLLAILFLK